MQWSLDQVREHPLWRGLTDKQRRFFELLEETELDDVAAALGAFDLQPKSVQVRLNQLRGAQDTGFLYRAMLGIALPTKEEVIAQIWQIATTTKDEARKLAALNKVAELQKPAKPSEPSAPKDPAKEEEPGEPIPDLSDFRE